MNIKTMSVQYLDRFRQDLRVSIESISSAAGLGLLIAAVAVYSLIAPTRALGAAPEAFASTQSAHTIDSNAVATVTLVLGKAYVDSQAHGRELIAAGSQITVGDQITTQANSRVHLRFVDGATMAVRNDSQLEILSYQYDAAKPEASKVKFNLVKGVTRAISGDAAKSARDQFRLNTPIAAIGVRGTDFVVSATQTSTRALVNEGIIVMAPLSASCSFDSFGPCIANAVELSGDNMQVAEMDQSGANPRVMTAAQDRGSEVLQQEVRSLIASNTAGSSDADGGNGYVEEVFLEESTSTKVAADATVDASITVPPGVPGTPGTEIPVPEIPAPVVPSFTPALPVEAATLTSNQLVWGRYAAGVGDLERITLPLAEARAGRAVSVGNFDYGLFRVEDEKQRLFNGLGVVGFDLRSAQATYTDASGISGLAVLGGNLEIDFQLNRFATELNLEHSEAGLIDFTAAGGLFDGGYFHSRDDQQRIAGAVSFDGTEAGYFFERQLEGASIQGLTLWDSP